MTDPAKPLTVAVTGASGFVGRALVRRLADDPAVAVRGCYRHPPVPAPPGVDVHITGDLVGGSGWAEAFAGADAVVHTAARAHVMEVDAANSLAAYRRINVEGTEAVAQAAADAGVRRLVFLSSIKVLGESTPIDRPFTEAALPAPEDAYGITKLEAEQALHAIAEQTELEVVVLRPPLILGSDAKGNIERLRRWITRGWPLPLGNIHNKRSLITLDGLCDVIVSALRRESVGGRTYLVADRDLSTPELVRHLAAEMGRTPLLLPMPARFLQRLASLAGRRREFERLVGSLLVDTTHAQTDLGLSYATDSPTRPAPPGKSSA